MPRPLLTPLSGGYRKVPVVLSNTTVRLRRGIPEGGQRGTILYTNASAAINGFPRSAAFTMACHAKKGLAQGMARELGPKGIHVAQVRID